MPTYFPNQIHGCQNASIGINYWLLRQSFIIYFYFLDTFLFISHQLKRFSLNPKLQYRVKYLKNNLKIISFKTRNV